MCRWRHSNNFMKLKKISETSLYVKDISEAEKFYVGILGLEIIEKNPLRHLFLRCGDAMLLLFNAKQTSIDTGVVPTHGTIGEGHIAFGIPESEFPYWEEYLKKNEISIEKKVGWEKGTKSIYFRDPSGNSLEFISENHWIK